MQWPRRPPHYAQQTRNVNPLPVYRWSTVAGYSHSTLDSAFCWLWCVHSVQVYTDPMSVNVGPASPELGSIHSALVVNSYWRYQQDALNQTVNVGPPSVTLAHIQRGAKHDTVTQYWANVGSASQTVGQHYSCWREINGRQTHRDRLSEQR